MPFAVRTAVRSLRRRPADALVNGLGLSLGLACCALIALHVASERGTDAQHAGADRVVRLVVDLTDASGTEQGLPSVPRPLLATVTDDPAVESVAGAKPGRLRVHRPGTTETADVLFAGAGFLDILNGFYLLAGNAQTALVEPNSIVLTEATARRLGAEAIGDIVEADNRSYTVTGIVAGEGRSHLAFDGLASLSTFGPDWADGEWGNFDLTLYARLRPDADRTAFQARVQQALGAGIGAGMAESGMRASVMAQPLRGIYLADDGRLEAPMNRTGSPTLLRILSLVGLFVLAIAVVNFVNLATARSLDRAREVGVRKSLGAGRVGLAGQFLAEAVVMSGVALVVAVVVAQLALPAFRGLSGKPLSLADLGWGWAGMVALAGATGLLAGAYSAFVLSGFHPAEVLKGRFATGHRGQAMRQGLVVVQFGISVSLIAATVIVSSQLRYIQSQDLGFDLGGDASQLLVLPFMGDSAVVSQLPALEARLRGTPGVDGATASLAAPTFGTYDAGGSVEGPDGADAELDAVMYLADTSYADVYGLELLAGRRQKATPPDTHREHVLRETAVREAGYASPQDVIGKPASFWGMDGEVVGVIGDLYTEGLQQAVRPLVLASSDDDVIAPNVLTLRVRTATLPSTLASVEALWKDAVPSRPFTYTFLDEDFAKQYVDEQRFGRLFGVFAGLAIAIACLGLFGLAAHTAASRTKEIGVRKVLGASVHRLTAMLAGDFVKLVAVAFGIAVPVSYLAMRRWLDGFATAVGLGPGVFLLAGGAVLFVALVAVGGQALRAATADSVRALRSE